MAQATVEKASEIKCQCGFANPDFKVIPIGLKVRTPGIDHKPNSWYCCGKCLVRILRQKAYGSYTVRMMD